ncbi:uncharacterized protein [Miscanthus floridulus]|uniref:uncharacterized protein n=1 Tax=Miscanthus floridulus TaxID=154761 RepID=UPI00345A74D7
MWAYALDPAAIPHSAPRHNHTPSVLPSAPPKPALCSAASPPPWLWLLACCNSTAPLHSTGPYLREMARPENTTTTTHRLQTLAPSLCRAAASSSPASTRAAPLSTSSVAAFRRTSPILSSPGDKPAPTKVEDVMPRRSSRLLHLDNEADRKTRSLKRWFPSTKMQRRFNKLLNDIVTDLVNLFPYCSH